MRAVKDLILGSLPREVLGTLSLAQMNAEESAVGL